MCLRVGEVAGYMEELAPLHLAMDWDNVGLLVGRTDAEVTNVLVALNYNDAVLKEALRQQANFIICHHPFLYKPIKSIRTDTPPGALLRETLINDLHVYASHTNLDMAEEGVSWALGKAFSLKNMQILHKTGEDPLLKLVVFVPSSHLDAVRDALALAGAGWIGSYSHCSFASPGTGTFMPREGTHPYSGQIGNLEKVQEVRLETILHASIKERALSAMIKAHPYEEVAFDLYPLALPGKFSGLGRLGELPKEITLKGLVKLIKKTLQVENLTVVGEDTMLIKKMAVCGGSGGDLIGEASRLGADVLLTGDIKHHQGEEAHALGIAVVDAGHAATEKVIIEPLASRLQEKVAAKGHKNKVISSQIDPSYWKLM